MSAVRELTSGGVDYVFECIGLQETCEQAAAMLAFGGTAVIVGQPTAGTRPSYDALLMSGYEQRVIGSNYGSMRASVDFPRLVDLYMSGRLMIDELITGHRPLAEDARGLPGPDRRARHPHRAGLRGASAAAPHHAAVGDGSNHTEEEQPDGH